MRLNHQRQLDILPDAVAGSVDADLVLERQAVGAAIADINGDCASCGVGGVGRGEVVSRGGAGRSTGPSARLSRGRGTREAGGKDALLDVLDALTASRETAFPACRGDDEEQRGGTCM